MSNSSQQEKEERRKGGRRQPQLSHLLKIGNGEKGESEARARKRTVIDHPKPSHL